MEQKNKKNRFNMKTLFIVSVVCIILCMGMLVSVTFAYYSIDKTVEGNDISASVFTGQIFLVDCNNPGEPARIENGTAYSSEQLDAMYVPVEPVVPEGEIPFSIEPAPAKVYSFGMDIQNSNTDIPGEELQNGYYTVTVVSKSPESEPVTNVYYMPILRTREYGLSVTVPTGFALQSIRFDGFWGELPEESAYVTFTGESPWSIVLGENPTYTLLTLVSEEMTDLLPEEEAVPVPKEEQEEEPTEEKTEDSEGEQRVIEQPETEQTEQKETEPAGQPENITDETGQVAE